MRIQFEIHFVTLEMGSTTVDILRPLVKKDVYFTLERRGWVGSTSIAAFLRLGIRNIAVSSQVLDTKVI